MMTMLSLSCKDVGTPHAANQAYVCRASQETPAAKPLSVSEPGVAVGTEAAAGIAKAPLQGMALGKEGQ